MSELQLCPFCGGHKCMGVYREPGLTFDRWRVGCDICGAEGPGRDTEDEAVTAWNIRTELDRFKAHVRVAVEAERVAVLNIFGYSRIAEIGESWMPLDELLGASNE